jgi:H+/Cl- antiporter ClcA
MKTDAKNEAKLLLFCTSIGSVAGIVFWIFLLLIKVGTALLWETVPANLSGGISRWYPLILCTIGGLIIGIYRKLLGDYPEEMMVVLGKLKKNGTYNYNRLYLYIIAAVLPLIIGSSVGPEAGMVGIIVGICCWAGENLRFAGKKTTEYSRIGAAVTLSVMFRSPLFGFFEVEEEELFEDEKEKPLPKSLKILLYCIAVGAGGGCYYLLNLVCRVSEGFPAFDKISVQRADFLMAILYLIAGIILGVFFEISEKLFETIAGKLPGVAKETMAGLILGTVICFLPVVKFSGEEQMAILIDNYMLYAPLGMIGIAFLKVAVTNMCIKMGLKGGHFFPLIFSAVCLGYGVSLLVFPQESAHATFAAAVVAAGTLGVTIKKPLAVSMLLLLCFPAGALVWIIPAAAIASFVGKRSSSS